MMNYRRFLCFLICISMLATVMVGCAGKSETETSTTQSNSTADNATKPTDPTSDGEKPDNGKPVTYSVTVCNEAGTALQKVTVELYSDSTLEDILQMQKTDATGTVTFNRKGIENGLVAVLKNVPVGYSVEEYYELTGQNTTITLKAGVPLEDSHLDSAKLYLGDAMLDFSFTASDGREVVLSELLQDYKAVVLNFWFMNCVPCKMEFPHLQEAYEMFSDDVAVIAMNPMDSSNPEIEAFRQENGYTFLMGKCDERLGSMMNVPAYPVTVVIDRYGNISMIHNGSVDNAQMFMDIFGFFCAEDYEQSFIRSHSQLPTYEP